MWLVRCRNILDTKVMTDGWSISEGSEEIPGCINGGTSQDLLWHVLPAISVTVIKVDINQGCQSVPPQRHSYLSHPFVFPLSLFLSVNLKQTLQKRLSTKSHFNKSKLMPKYFLMAYKQSSPSQCSSTPASFALSLFPCASHFHLISTSHRTILHRHIRSYHITKQPTIPKDTSDRAIGEIDWNFRRRTSTISSPLSLSFCLFQFLCRPPSRQLRSPSAVSFGTCLLRRFAALTWHFCQSGKDEDK